MTVPAWAPAWVLYSGLVVATAATLFAFGVFQGEFGIPHPIVLVGLIAGYWLLIRLALDTLAARLSSRCPACRSDNAERGLLSLTGPDRGQTRSGCFDCGHTWSDSQ